MVPPSTSPTPPRASSDLPEAPRATVSVVGSTGLVGRALVEALLEDPRVGEVHAFQRRPGEGFVYGPHGARLRVHPTDFERWATGATVPDDEGPRGSVLFSALGTTRRAAGGEAAQYRVDHDYQVAAARRAAEAGVSTLVLVSSMGARSDASAFYLRMKGEIEASVSALPFRTIHLLRPGILDGDRDEFRPMERVGIAMARVLARLGAPPRLRPIPAPRVAAAMLRLGLEGGAGEGPVGTRPDPGARSPNPVPPRADPGAPQPPRVRIHEAEDLFRLTRIG